MEIDDILKQSEFKHLDDFLTNEMHEVGGNDLVIKMVEIFEERENARDWFYSPIKALGGNRPYDYCKSGKAQEVRDVLGRIEYGVYS